ncbi:MAG: Uma2 family endonuclease [Candidatus Cloacimonetes bacterium]|nr:Uma2 family endonuclease [Candidatus Cloacimonadota bacterium]
MARPQEKMKELYTYEDYLTWDDDVRYELIDGVPYALASPLPVHQLILGELHHQFKNYLKGKPCMVIQAPSDVRLFDNNEKDTVVQPDLYVFCDKSKFKKQAYTGIPELVVEIISPSTSERDKFDKFHKYLRAKIPEYWIVEPDSKTVNVLILDDDRYITNVYNKYDTIMPSRLPGCIIDLSEVFRPVSEFEEIKEESPTKISSL